MKETEDKTTTLSRKEFLKKIVRLGLLGILTLAAGSLFLKKTYKRGENECINTQNCRPCGLLDDCALPQGISARHILKGRNS